MVDLTIAIATSNNYNMLRELIESIKDHTHKVSYELIVIYNNCTDKTVPYLQGLDPAIIMIENQVFPGYAASHNMALSRGSGRYHLVLNDDMLLVTDTFDEVVAYMDSHTEVGITGCRLQFADESPQISAYSQHPGFKTELREFLLINAFFRAFGIKTGWDQFGKRVAETSKPTQVAHLMGAFLMISRKCLNDIGPMDEGFFSGFEDQDWCIRACKRGYVVSYLPQSVMVHYGNVSIGKWVRKRAMANQLHARLYFHRKHRGRASQLALSSLIATGYALKLPLAFTRAILKGKNPTGDNEVRRCYYGLRVIFGLQPNG
jgi:GT2 family glycosyltransferase